MEAQGRESTIMKKEHFHSFTEIVGERVKVDNPRYKGSTSDKAFLLRECPCGAMKAFEYGEYKYIAKLWIRLKESTLQSSASSDTL